MSTNLQRFDFPAGRDLEAIAERELWTSVVLQTVDDLTGPRGPNPRAIEEAARRWFESTSEEPGHSYGYAIFLILLPTSLQEEFFTTAGQKECSLVYRVAALSNDQTIGPTSIKIRSQWVPKRK